MAILITFGDGSAIPKAGLDLKLSVDMGLMQTLYQALDGKVGAAGITDQGTAGSGGRALE